MEELVNSYLEYLKDVKHISHNTEISYARDLNHLLEYLKHIGIEEAKQISPTLLNSYVLYMEKRGFANTSISRNMAVLRGLFDYLFKNHVIDSDVSDCLVSPKVASKPAKKIRPMQAEEIMDFPTGDSPKALRDRAMLKLLYVTGIQVSDLITLKQEHINIRLGFVVCEHGGSERTYPLNEDVKQALWDYQIKGRDQIVKDPSENLMFVNMNGRGMSRQGFWKMMKSYLKKNGVDETITLSMIRHSFQWYDQYE